MSKYCRRCGTKLDDNEKFCTECGMKYAEDEKGDVTENNKKVSLVKCKKPLLITLVIIILIGVLGCFVIYPKVTDYLHNKENQKAAQKVVNLIDSLNGKEITADSENDLDRIRLEYDSLSKEQKELVVNYSSLEKAYERVEESKNQKVADEIISAIDKIDKDNLTVFIIWKKSSIRWFGRGNGSTLSRFFRIGIFKKSYQGKNRVYERR